MDIFLKVALGIHIFAGFLSLVTAPVAMIVQKGGNAHRQWGKVYFGGMTVVAITAFLISLFKSIPFLLMLSVFSYYAAVDGYRSLYMKNLHKGQKVKTLDWAIAIITGIFSIGLIVYAIHFYMTKPEEYKSFAIVISVFGFLGVNGVYKNLRKFRNPPKDKMDWFYSHISGMMGSYIATVSAFSATNFYFLPPVLRWLWPTLLGVPFMMYWIKGYRKKFNEKKIQVSVSDSSLKAVEG